MSRIKLWGFICSIALSIASVAAADDFHYQNQVIGDRAFGMAGAYVAVSDDVSGLYYNPAGIAYSTGTNLSASVNAYYDQTKKFENVIAGKEWKRTSSSLLPNYFGVIQPYGKLKVGFSYAVPDSINEDQNQTFYGLTPTINSFTINFTNQDYTYLFGPTVAMELSKNLAVGLTVYLHQRRSHFILNQLVDRNTTLYEWTNTNFESNENGYRPIVGMIWSPVEKFSAGLTVQKTFIYDSKTTNEFTCSDTIIDGSGCDKPIFRTDEFTNTKRKYPTHIALGLAYFPSKSLIISLDVNSFGKAADAEFGDKLAVTNLAVGAEYYLNQSWAVRGGIYTNKSSAPAITPGVVSVAEDKTDIKGMTASISNFSKNSSLTLGASVSSGNGKAQVTTSTETQSVKVFGWAIILSSSYSF